MNNYVPPSMAYRQLNNAYEMGDSVYIYGATGYGKTRLVQEFLKDKDSLWIPAGDDNKDIIEDNKHVKCVVFDNIQSVNSSEQKDYIVQCLKNKSLFVVMIGRARSPQWLIPFIAEGLVRVISEKQLHMTADEIVQMAQINDISLSNEEAVTFEQNSDGNAYAISAAIQLLKSNNGNREDLDRDVKVLFINHLEQEVIPQWDMCIQEFLMMISVVDEFNLPMAVMITGDDQAAKLIEEALNLGNFMSADGEIYRIRPQLLKALRNRAMKVFGLGGYKRYMANAAHYYEIHDDILKSLELYEKCDKKDSIKMLLVRHSRRHPGVGHYYALRNYYFELDEEDIENVPILMSAMSMLYSILLNPDKSEYWYEKLKEYEHKVKAGEKREADELLLYLDLALPHRGSQSMQSAFKQAFSLIRTGNVKIPELSITNNGPSAMNGGKDFCEWSKKDTFLADTIGKIVEAVTGDTGRGLVHAALSESIFEKGNNDAKAAHHAMLLNLDVEGGGKYELLFVSIAIQARIAIITGNSNNAFRVIDAFEERIRNYDNEALKNNLKAFRCRMALITGKTEYVDKWLREAPDEVVEFCVLERYNYMTKALCYVQLGMNLEAIDILAKLRYYSEEYQRRYIHMETGLLLSIISRRNGGLWKDLFISTLLEIQEYRFVRIISEKGAGILPLLKEIKKDYLSEKKADSSWFTKTIKETEMLAKRYPGFLCCSHPQPNDFSEADIRILELQAEGLSTKEIAGIIYMSERTVKYHASENYRKLGASGKVEAIQIAKSINLIN